MRPHTRYIILGLIILCSGCIDKQRDSEETNYPLVFLTLKETEGNDPLKIEGEILNHSYYTSYGNISLLVTYYSHRDAKIGSERFMYYQIIKPGERGDYSFEIHPPPPPQHETKEIIVSIINAQPWMK